MVSFILFLLFVGIVLWASYRKIGLAATTALIGVVLATYTLTGTAASWWKAALWAAYLPLVLLNVAPLRLRFLSRPFFRVYKRMLPAMSSTEQEALEAGTVWWDGERPGRPRQIPGARRRSRPSDAAGNVGRHRHRVEYDSRGARRSR